MASRSRKTGSTPSPGNTRRKQIDRAFEKAIAKETPEAQEVKRLERKLKAAGLSIREERRYAKELEKRLEVAEKRADFALALEAHDATEVKFTPRRFARQDAVAHIVHSDLHIGERVDPKRVNYTNRYDETIAAESFNQLWELSIQLLKWRRLGNLRIDTAVLALIGDLMTGHLHEDQKRTNTMHPFQESAWLLERYEYWIPRFMDETKVKKLWVPCARGNHGRNYDGKKRYAVAAEDSFEQFIYGELARRFKGDRRIEFVLSESEFTYGRIFDRRIRYMHGDQFRFAGGVGGIAVPLMRFLTRLDQNDPGGRADHNFMGHWHDRMNLGNVTINGSLIGTTTYGAGLGFYGPPQQDFSLWNPDDGMIDSAPICIQRKL